MNKSTGLQLTTNLIVETRNVGCIWYNVAHHKHGPYHEHGLYNTRTGSTRGGLTCCCRCMPSNQLVWCLYSALGLRVCRCGLLRLALRTSSGREQGVDRRTIGHRGLRCGCDGSHVLEELGEREGSIAKRRKHLTEETPEWLVIICVFHAQYDKGSSMCSSCVLAAEHALSSTALHDH